MQGKNYFRIAFATAALSLFAVTGAAALDATVVSVKGKTEIQSGSNWIPLTVGTTISKGTVISTGFKSELVLKVRDSIITVAPLTRLTLEQIIDKPNKDETRVYLDTGSISSNIKHTENRRTGFTVRSPVATASVRGTISTVANNFRSTTVTTEQGIVAAWRSTGTSGPHIASDAEDAAPALLPGTGSTPAEIAPAAPSGACTVNAGQTAGFRADGTTTTPQQYAAKRAYTLSSATEKAAAAESETTGETGNSITNTTASKTSKTASVNVILEFTTAN